ncbi:MAG: FRG domain-containing protein [Campylobacterota bacterium]|nr:FRG domain-containing protein [Campylobacterota bacterium]
MNGTITYETREIESLNGFISELEKDYSNYDGSVWYRGQSNATYKLLPSYTRDKDVKEYPPETTLLSAFKQNAIMLTSKQPTNSFDRMFLMQHYGIPTRLLDWSESPLVALYFALKNINNTNDAVVWSLKPTELNKIAHINNPSEDFFIPSCDDMDVLKYSIDTMKLDTGNTGYLPIAVIASRNNVRIQAQQGVFTIHYKGNEPIEELSNGEHVIKYIIKKEHIKTISKQLSILGINKFQLFPELASIKDVILKGN